MLKKIMKINEYKDGDSFWQIACDCTDPDHQVSLWFDNYEDYPHLDINMNLTLDKGKLNTWKFFPALYFRIKTAFRVLAFGEIDYSGSAILDKDGIIAMQTALEEGLEIAEKSKATVTVPKQ